MGVRGGVHCILGEVHDGHLSPSFGIEQLSQHLEPSQPEIIPVTSDQIIRRLRGRIPGRNELV